MILLLVMTDGRRDCIAQATPSALANLHGEITHRVIHDDSGDPEYRAWLADTFPQFDVWHTPRRRGFGEAIRNAWRLICYDPADYSYVAHVEDDFTFNRAVNLDAMARVLDARPHLVQLALRRQPWNDNERAAGGIVEQHPDDFAAVDDGEHRWLEHRRFFTTNPSLYRRSLCSTEWPAGKNSEGRFTHPLLRDSAVRFGYWGARDSGEWVTHIGHERVGVGY